MSVDMKLMIASTFAKMAHTKHIDKITVKDLVEQCGISRQAFYYHFQDMLEVMEWSIKQLLQQALQESLRAESPEQAIEAFIRISAEYQEPLSRVMASQRRAELEQIYVEAMRSSIRQMISRKKPELALNHQDMEIALNFYAYGLAGAVFENCRHNGVDHSALSHKLYLLLSGRMLSD